MTPLGIAFAVIALALGAALIWLLLERARLAGREIAAREHAQSLEADAKARAEALTAARESLARAEEQLHALREQQAQEADRLRRQEQAFESLSAKALRTSTEEFLKLATEKLGKHHQHSEAELEKRKEAVTQLIKPIAETLAKTDEKLAQIEQSRIAAFAKLGQHMETLGAAGADLRAETAKLGRALREPHVRGRYGEIQLRRVAELAGMIPYCDFCEQTSTRAADGRLLRPDMTVELPNGRVVAVDAKTNIHAYLEALETDAEEAANECLDRFARHVAEQVTSLARKGYWSEFDKSPEFVVMFLPGDQFLDAALSRRRDLLERAAEQGVILASPATLIGLLRAVAVGWREHKLAEEAKELFELGRELHQRASVAFDHAARLGKAINSTVETYNKFASSVDARLMPTLRKFEETGVKSGKEIADLPEITVIPRSLEAAEDQQPRLL